MGSVGAFSETLSESHGSVLFVSEIRADRRSRECDPVPGRVDQLRELAEQAREVTTSMAKLLHDLGRSGEHLTHGFSSVHDFVREDLGIPSFQIRPMLDLGRALGLEASHVEVSDGEGDEDAAAAPPTVEDRVAVRAMSIDNAVVLGALYRRLGQELSDRERARWTRLAERVSTHRLRGLVRKRVEDAAQGEETVPLALRVTESTREAFRRARELASRRAGQWLTEGQVFSLVVRRFVDTEDERLRGEKLRRVPDTRALPGDRYIPAQVKRDVRRRAHDRCEVPGCSFGAWVEFMHVAEAHRDGGSREADNLVLGCSTHHVLLDAGVIRFGGWRDGKPVFLDRNGREIRRGSVEQRPLPPEAGSGRRSSSEAGPHTPPGSDEHDDGSDRPPGGWSSDDGSDPDLGGPDRVAEREPVWRSCLARSSATARDRARAAPHERVRSEAGRSRESAHGCGPRTPSTVIDRPDRPP